MEHWFDRATKTFAGSFPRRDLLRGAAVTGMSTLIPKLPSFWDGVTSAAPSPCVVHSSPAKGTSFQVTATGRYGRELVTVDYALEILGYKYPKSVMTLRAALGGRTVLSVRVDTGHTFGPKHTRNLDIRVSELAEPSPGVRRRMEVLVRRGTMQGFLDGHPFRTTLADAKTALPSITAGYKPPLDPALARTISDLAKDAAATCKVPGRAPSVARSRASMLAFASTTTRTSDAAAPTEVADNISCEICQTLCYATFLVALAGLGWATGPTAVLLEGLDEKTILEPCLNLCDVKDGPCCNLYCHSHDIGDFCCPAAATCCVDTCCGWGLPVCAPISNVETGDVGFCCPANYFGCYSWGDHCCPNGTTCCSNNCCDNNTQSCVEQEYGFCCPRGQIFCNFTCCSGACIAGPSGTYDGTCCQAGYTNCGGACCRPDWVCLDGSGGPSACCPQGNQNCGGACCPPTWKCYQASTGQNVCCDKPLCGDECCAGVCVNGKCCNGRPCGDNCCGVADGPCCSGVCCAANQVCATNPIRGASPCVTAPCPPSEVPCPNTPGMCCPPDYQCCPQVNQCCKPGTECCGTRGCLLPSVCTP